MTARARDVAVWWRSADTTRSFWRLLVVLAGVHAIVVGYAVLWVTWVGPTTGLDTDSARIVPEPIQRSFVAYAIVALVLFLTAALTSGYRSNKGAPGKALFAGVATYLGFALGYVWVNFRLPSGRNFIDAWLPVSQTLATPLLWPAYAAAALMLWRVLRRPQVVGASYSSTYRSTY